MIGPSDLWRRLAAALEAGEGAGLVTILAVEGSAPRGPGTRLLVAGGGFSGTIGGGALEWQALGECRQLMAAVPAGAGRILDIALGPALGQCCGGRVRLLVEAFGVADRDWIAALAGLGEPAPATRGRADARGIFRRLPSEPPGSFIWADGRLDEPGEPAPEPLLLFGAGHVGRAVVLALAPLPFRVRWVDPRPEAFPAHHPANAAVVPTPDPPAEIAAAMPGTMVLILTHSHALDLALADAALRRPDLPFVGLIGSASKRARFLSRLAAAGHGEAALGRFVCPIGLPGLGGGHGEGKAPAIIAAGVAVDLLRRRAGRCGITGRLAPGVPGGIRPWNVAG